ncbi:MAG: NAD(P)/FAD-dependent oxidoreductase [Verrucomicrobiota bacterium]
MVGGGAAGFFGAIAFAELRRKSRVAILEKSSSVLGKVKISGGGRCNVTHACYEPIPLTHHYPRGEKQLIGPYHRFLTSDTIDWFESRGVELKVEEDGRIFPVTDDSATIIDCLRSAAEEAGVEVRNRVEVESLEKSEASWILQAKGGEAFASKLVLLASGGIRNGAGPRLIGELGHEIVPAVPSLFSFHVKDPLLEDLAGISVERVITKVPSLELQSDGPILVTHWGLSGPAILKLSAWGARELENEDYRFELLVDWTQGMDRMKVDEGLQEARDRAPRKRVSSGVDFVHLPARLWKRLVQGAGVGEETTWSNLTKEERRNLLCRITETRLQVDGKSLNKDEFVTAGGVSLDEVNLRTMESRRAKGLYFACEVLDIDGITGGFNFQAAWTTSWIAGRAAAQSFS